ncbi:MAG: glycosyltransferase family 4 protein [Chloroflexaceae bacterium]|nr:glycosyltransferase family 4 protein [Chloroflexaceae bacterium]
MKVIILSKAFVVGAYQRKLEELAQLPGVELLALVPPRWREPRVGTQKLERRFTAGYRLQTLPILLNGQHHTHFYPTLGWIIARERPDILHVDEEAFNLATFLAVRAGVATGARCCFFNWANMDRWYPPPFNLFERYVFRHAAHAIAGNREAASIIRRHGYSGPLSVLPQFGVDPELFSPQQHSVQAPVSGLPSSVRVGYIGRLVPEKGVLGLVEALAGLPNHVQLLLVGDGELRPLIERRAAALGLSGRVAIRPAVSSTAVPQVLHELDVLVLPSRTMPNWKEQFGRILVEAMSCGVPVVGSASGEIPNVIGEGGLVFPEGDVAALRAALAQLLADAGLRREIGQRGRARVLANYTQAAIARQTYDIYMQMLNGSTIHNMP